MFVAGAVSVVDEYPEALAVEPGMFFYDVAVGGGVCLQAAVVVAQKEYDPI